MIMKVNILALSLIWLAWDISLSVLQCSLSTSPARNHKLNGETHLPTSHHRLALGHVWGWQTWVHPFQSTLHSWHMSLVFYLHSAPLPLWDYSGSTEGTFSALTNTEGGYLLHCKAKKNGLKGTNNMFSILCISCQMHAGLITLMPGFLQDKWIRDKLWFGQSRSAGRVLHLLVRLSTVSNKNRWLGESESF